ncbi:uncharacterized protein si:dkeyp-113d7.10 isoform X2 [Nerophis ophidion]|uniref:uncharacterized protein si:dkeyp-113d7.10 isoform X2 n=1 Tax=Nerophis ophidion TaxID=159077 RepID=UPI002ADFCB65|nr:uncharacterized protein si:dkeyp-113d7.10 isoform X2 [Nerophis ophidion]
MNGAVYIPFFQGQLESVLEQVVQLAVQEISSTVGSSLNALLLEATVKEQENRRLQLRLQAWEDRGRAHGGPKQKAAQAAADEKLDGGRTKLEPPPGAQPRGPPDAARLEQRSRVVDQLKVVMEQVLNFAMRELKKIVEASFDDLLLEITKKEQEQQTLEDKLDQRGGGTRTGARRGSENDSVSPSGSEDAREDPPAVTADPGHRPDISVSQDWVPILDKVFGQRWCSDDWQVKESAVGGGLGGPDVPPPPVTLETLEASPSSPHQDPRWTPLEDMDVLSPDEDTGGGARPSSAPPLSPSGSSGRRSSASMLQRLLTLPSQLLDDHHDPGGARKKPKEVKDGRDDDGGRTPGHTSSSPLTTEEEEDGKRKKKKRRKLWSQCDDCGRRFSHVSTLGAHAANASVGCPPAQCSGCGLSGQHPVKARGGKKDGGGAQR